MACRPTRSSSAPARCSPRATKLTWLVAFNPAAFTTNIGFLKRGGTVVVDEGAFNTRGFAKAKLEGDPVDEKRIRTLPGDPGRYLQTHGRGGRAVRGRAQGCYAGAQFLGARGCPCGSTDSRRVRARSGSPRRFAKDTTIAGANAAALKAGHAYGETMELALAEPAVVLGETRPFRHRRAMVSGTDAMALGIAAISALAERPVTYCSYPITPASVLLHALARMPEGVRTFQGRRRDCGGVRRDRRVFMRVRSALPRVPGRALPSRPRASASPSRPSCR